MAIINHTYKFVFVHIPKAAGTSITNILSGLTTYLDIEVGGTQFGEDIQKAYSQRFGIYKHAPAARLKLVMGATTWTGYFTFTFVRNPYSRVVSVYKFLRQWQGCPHDVKKKMLSFSNVNDYVLSSMWDETGGPDEIFRPQTYWVTDPEDRKALLVNKFYKIEKIESGVNDIYSNLKIGAFDGNVPVLNISEDEASNLQLSRKSLDKINKYYERDFKFFDYELL